jgi:predicted secreted protein
MTILCGSFQVVLDALNQINEENELFESPTSIIPVNIGGLSAWIIQLKRTGNAAVSLKNHRKRAAAIIRRRYQTLTAGSKRLQA